MGTAKQGGMGIMEKEYSVTVTGSWGVMAESQEAANKWILNQIHDGNINYTTDIEAVEEEAE